MGINSPRRSLAVLCLTTMPWTASAVDTRPLPGSWEMIGIGRGGYSSGVDMETTRSGKPSGYVKSKDDSVTLPGVLSQSFDAAMYRGRRLRYSAYLKFDHVKRQAGLWMWVVGGNHVLTSDFMDDRILKGDSDWRPCEIVLDIPKNAERIVYGARLWGPGEIWVNGMRLEVVGKDVPITVGRKGHPLAPVNLF